MRRITISVNDDLADEFDRLLNLRGYQNRSEAFRDLVRGALEADRLASETALHCVACLSYVYNHHEHDLAARVAASHHAHHDVSVSTMRVHLDHDHCLETATLRGPTADVKRFSQALIAERGVRHGHINLVPVEVGQPHEHIHAAEVRAEARPRSDSHRPAPPHEHAHHVRHDHGRDDDHDHRHGHGTDSAPHVHVHPKT